MQVNTEKTKTIHVRPPGTPCTTYNFTYGKNLLSGVDSYHYLGYWLHCHLSETVMIDSITKSGERALGSVINKVKKNGDVGLSTFETLYRMCVIPVTDYCGGIWGIGGGKCQRKLDMID